MTVQDRKIDLVIDGTEVSVQEGTMILDAAKSIGVEIPMLCYLEKCGAKAVCRMCVVELENGRLVTACSTICQSGMIVKTSSDKVKQSRKMTLQMLMTRHLNSCFSCDKYPACAQRQKAYCNYDKNCFTCGQQNTCLLRKYCLEYGVDTIDLPVLAKEQEKEEVANVLIYDVNHCILCRRCKTVCEEDAGQAMIALLGRGSNAMMSFSLCNAEICKECGRCVAVCPTGALSKVNG